MDLKTVAAVRRPAVIAQGGGQEVKLDIGPFQTRAGADEGTGFEMVGAAQTGFRQIPAGADEELGEPAQMAIQGDGPEAFELQADLQVVGQIGADARQVVELGYARRRQNVPWPDTR
jgi:hypothetical protein